MQEKTFTLIKPNAVGKGQTGEILAGIEKAGFRILALKLLFLSRSDAEKFYAEHRERPFFLSLCLFLSSGPVVVAVLEKENAIADLRTLTGATDPLKAKPGTLRHLYGESLTRNAIHASDSPSAASREMSFFFSDKEIIEASYLPPRENN